MMWAGYFKVPRGQCDCCRATNTGYFGKLMVTIRVAMCVFFFFFWGGGHVSGWLRLSGTVVRECVWERREEWNVLCSLVVCLSFGGMLSFCPLVGILPTSAKRRRLMAELSGIFQVGLWDLSYFLFRASEDFVC